MSFSYKERPSDSPFAAAIWRTQDKTDGLYLAPADGCWDLTFIDVAGDTKILLSGPSSQATPVSYRAGTQNFGIRFKPSTFMPKLPAPVMLDVTKKLAKASPRHFWFDHGLWEIPTYDNAETFLQKLTSRKLLASDAIVETALQGAHRPLSDRTVQRHFLYTTGMTPGYLKQINRAHQAMALLKGGAPILQVVYELGYSDQPHMTRILKHLTGQTPAQIAGLRTPISSQPQLV